MSVSAGASDQSNPLGGAPGTPVEQTYTQLTPSLEQFGTCPYRAVPAYRDGPAGIQKKIAKK